MIQTKYVRKDVIGTLNVTFSGVSVETAKIKIEYRIMMKITVKIVLFPANFH